MSFGWLRDRLGWVLRGLDSDRFWVVGLADN